MPGALRLIASVIRWLANLAFTASLVWGAWILGSQCVNWLRFGSWKPEPFLYYMARFVDSMWMVMPFDWRGVHQALNSLNAGVGIILFAGVAGFLVSLCAAVLENEAASLEASKSFR